jgi:hypothetical protein
MCVRCLAVLGFCLMFAFAVLAVSISSGIGSAISNSEMATILGGTCPCTYCALDCSQSAQFCGGSPGQGRAACSGQTEGTRCKGSGVSQQQSGYHFLHTSDRTEAVLGGVSVSCNATTICKCHDGGDGTQNCTEVPVSGGITGNSSCVTNPCPG